MSVGITEMLSIKFILLSKLMKRINDCPEMQLQQGPPRKYYMITDYGREQLNELDAAWDELARGIETIRNGSKA